MILREHIQVARAIESNGLLRDIPDRVVFDQAILGKIEEAGINGINGCQGQIFELGFEQAAAECVGFLKLPVIDFEVSIDAATPAAKVRLQGFVRRVFEAVFGTVSCAQVVSFQSS